MAILSYLPCAFGLLIQHIIDDAPSNTACSFSPSISAGVLANSSLSFLLNMVELMSQLKLVF